MDHDKHLKPAWLRGVIEGGKSPDNTAFEKFTPPTTDEANAYLQRLLQSDLEEEQIRKALDRFMSQQAEQTGAPQKLSDIAQAIIEDAPQNFIFKPAQSTTKPDNPPPPSWEELESDILTDGCFGPQQD